MYHLWKLSLAICLSDFICAVLGTPSARTPATESSTLPAEYRGAPIVERDVAIVGGGSSGTYTAIRLKDSGKSVVVLEAKSRLGGHTETYKDPSGVNVDIGVIVWHPIDIVKKYFARLGVELAPSTGFQGVGTRFVRADFRTGKVLKTPPYSQNETAAALQVYAGVLAKYPELTKGFYYPKPVPEDLTITFGALVKKYRFDAAVPTITNFAQGYGNALEIPAIYIMKLFGLDILSSIQAGFVKTAANDNSLLYDKAAEVLGDDAWVNIHIVSVIRSQSGVLVLVKTPSGPKVIKAKKIVITVPPTYDGLRPFLGLTDQEKQLFKKFRGNGYYAGVLKNTGIPNGTNIEGGADDTPYTIPPLPGMYGVTSMGNGVFSIKYGSQGTLSDAFVKKDIIAQVERLKKGGAVPTARKPDIVFYSGHTPFALNVEAKAIEGGFYEKLYGLQGMHNTYWTGATWNTHDSSLIWRFTEENVLPKLLQGL